MPKAPFYWEKVKRKELFAATEEKEKQTLLTLSEISIY